MSSRESILVIGRGALAVDVLRARMATADPGRMTLVSTCGDGATPGSVVLDPFSPSASRSLAAALLEARPTLVAVLALSESPVTPAEPWIHDAALAQAVVSALGLYLGHAGTEAPALLVLSSTSVYGVAAASPLVFDERSRLPGPAEFVSAASRWAAGLRAAERALVVQAVESGAGVGVLRAASVLGGPVDSPLAALLRSPFPVRVLGYDPPVQVLHYEDLVEAVTLAVADPPGEVLNLVGAETTPLSRLLAMAGVFAPPLPGPLADRLAPASLDGAHLRWRTLVDGRRATQLLGFRPKRTVEECLAARR